MNPPKPMSISIWTRPINLHILWRCIAVAVTCRSDYACIIRTKFGNQISNFHHSTSTRNDVIHRQLPSFQRINGWLTPSTRSHPTIIPVVFVEPTALTKSPTCTVHLSNLRIVKRFYCPFDFDRWVLPCIQANNQPSFSCILSVTAR